jgi:uncharacterized protein YecT (DUF1311 family)
MKVGKELGVRWSLSVVLCLFVYLTSTTIVTQEAAASEHEGAEYTRDTTVGIHTMWLTDTKVEILYASQECIGDFTGLITDHGSYLTAVDPNPALAPECVFTITPDGENAYLIEQGMGCTAYHGAACHLSGRVEKVATFSPSFDCSGALTDVEERICSDRDLSALDVLLSEAFELARNNPNLDSQRDWLAERDNCADELCLRNEIGSRVAELLHLAASPQNSLDGVEVEVMTLEEDGVFLRCRENYQGTDEVVYSELLFSREEGGPTFQETNILPDNRFSESVWGWYDWTATGNAGGLNFESNPNNVLLRRTYDVSASYVAALESGAVFSWRKRQFEDDKLYFVAVNFSGGIVPQCYSAVGR